MVSNNIVINAIIEKIVIKCHLYKTFEKFIAIFAEYVSILNWATFGAQTGIFDTERPDFWTCITFV